jgi:uncharacterized membrane protein
MSVCDDSFFFQNKTQIQINDNFAKLGEALAIADRHAREEVRVRAEMQAKLAAKEKKEKEDKLRLLAQRAREERSGIAPSQQSTTLGGTGKFFWGGLVFVLFLVLSLFFPFRYGTYTCFHYHVHVRYFNFLFCFVL